MNVIKLPEYDAIKDKYASEFINKNQSKKILLKMQLLKNETDKNNRIKLMYKSIIDKSSTSPHSQIHREIQLPDIKNNALRFSVTNLYKKTHSVTLRRILGALDYPLLIC